MNIEQAIDILKNSIADYVIGEYCEKCVDNKICDDRNEDCYYQQAIDIVVIAYEKQSKEIEELKEKTKKCEYYEMVADELYKNSVSKDKIKAKIEECKKEFYESKDEKGYFHKPHYADKVLVLQSLLEKE